MGPSASRGMLLWVKVLSWNMAAGYGYSASGHALAWEWLDAQDADVALLQEVVLSQSRSARWRTVIHSRGRGKGSVGWGCAVLATDERYRPYAPREQDVWLFELDGSVCIAEPTVNDGAVPWLISLHSNAYPMKPERLAGRDVAALRACKPGTVWEVEAAANDLEPILRGERFLVGGDLNSSLLFDTVNRYAWNQRLFDNLRMAGFVDLRPRHFTEEQQTFFRAATRPYQLDHVFADEQTEATVTSWSVATRGRRGAPPQ